MRWKAIVMFGALRRGCYQNWDETGAVKSAVLLTVQVSREWDVGLVTLYLESDQE